MMLMTNCDHVTRAAGDFLERRLRWRERLEFVLHVAMCKGCRAYVEQVRLTMLALRSLPEPASVQPSQDLLERFRHEMRKRD